MGNQTVIHLDWIRNLTWMLTLFVVVCLGGCVSGSHYGAGTLVGIRVGTQEGVGFTLGYQKYELGVCGPAGQATVDLTEKMSPDGVERTQILTLGPEEK